MVNFRRLLIALIILNSIKANCQDFSSAQTIFYNPVKPKIYFALDLTPVQLAASVKNGEEPELPVRIDENAPVYQPGGDYQEGDLLRVLAARAPGGEPQYLHIKIVGRMDDAIWDSLDQYIQQKVAALFAPGKLITWPEANYTTKMGLVVPDEKNTDCDYYVLNKFYLRTSYHGPSSVYFNTLGMTDGETDSLIVFQVYNQNNKWSIKEVNTVSGYSIGLFKKDKKGKKGKKLSGKFVMNLPEKFEVFGTLDEREIVPVGPYFDPRLNAFVVMDSLAEKLVEENTEYIKAKVLKAINMTFDKVKK